MSDITIVDLWAEWCGPCHMMAPVFKQLQSEFTDIKFEKINIDENPEVTQGYNVRSIPTFLMLKDGQEIGRKVGATSIKEMKEWISTAEKN